MTLEQLTVLLASLGGLATLNAFIINVLKTLGVVKDGTAGNWATGFNLFELLALFLTGVLAPNVDLGLVSAIATALANLGALVLPLLLAGMGGTALLGHMAVKGFPLIGKSFEKPEK